MHVRCVIWCHFVSCIYADYQGFFTKFLVVELDFGNDFWSSSGTESDGGAHIGDGVR